MPSFKNKNSSGFEAINFGNVKLQPIQLVAQSVVNRPEFREVHLSGSRQWGKSFFVFNDLQQRIRYTSNELFGVAIPLDTELDRFISQRLCDVLGVDKDGNKCTSIQEVKIPIYQDGKNHMVKYVKEFSRSDVPYIKFFNNTILMFFAGNANPEQHIPGNAFCHFVCDEYSKYPRPIAKEILPALTQKNGKLVVSTTLNEEDPNNWYSTQVLNDFHKNGKSAVETEDNKLCGLELTTKTVDREQEFMQTDGTIKTERIIARSALLNARLSKVYPWIRNGHQVYKNALASVELGQITQAQYNILYEGIPDNQELVVLSNFNRKHNTIDYQEIDENALKIQIIGYDHGTGKTGSRQSNSTCAAAWARVAMIYRPDIPDYEQFIILDSGALIDEEAESRAIAHKLDSFQLPVFVDATLFRTTVKGEPPDVHHIVKHAPGLGARTRPAGGKKVNDSRVRVRFWQKGTKVIDLDSENDIKYTHPLDSSKPGCQIYVAVDKNDPFRNARLLDEIENWQMKRDKVGNLKQDPKAVNDVWDAASMAITSYRKQRDMIIRYFMDVAKEKQKPVQKMAYRRGIPAPQSYRNSNFSR